MKSYFLCVIGINLLAQAQPFLVHNSMSLLLNSMYSGIQKLFLNMGNQIPGSFQEEQEDNYNPINSGGEIYVILLENINWIIHPFVSPDTLPWYTHTDVTMRTTRPFAASSQLFKTYAECAKRGKVDAESIDWLNRGYWKEEHDIKVWVHCVLVQNGLMTNQSVFRLDVAFQNVPNFERPILEAKIDKCLPTSAMEPLDISWHFAKCYQRVNSAKSLF